MSKTKAKSHTINSAAKNLTALLAILVIILSIPAFLYIYFIGRIYPNVYIGNINVGGKTKTEAVSLINPQINTPESVSLIYKNKNYDIPVNTLEIKFDETKTVKRALQLGRSGNILFDVNQIINSLKNKTTYPIELTFNENNFENYINTINKDIDEKPQNAKFEMIGTRVQNFTEGINGLKINAEKLKKDLIDSLNKNESRKIAINIETQVVEPEVKTSDVNNLGIKELIGSGTSHFAGSIPSRVFNINLASSRINGSLIAPGTVFSFDNTVGDISALNGYQQAYIISNGQTILGDGGGVCQVSTTIFRAAMNSGLPILERHAHAYRVHYYEEDALPGFDATIYTPTVDFQFKNDTGNYILVQTQMDTKNLVLTFNFYGTKDGRTVDITKPVLSNYRPAPADAYIDDPTLPLGQIKQIDFAATGINSTFDYTVTKNGKVINQQTFKSVFTPWQAKFLKGTKTS